MPDELSPLSERVDAIADRLAVLENSAIAVTASKVLTVDQIVSEVLLRIGNAAHGDGTQ